MALRNEATTAPQARDAGRSDSDSPSAEAFQRTRIAASMERSPLKSRVGALEAPTLRERLRRLGSDAALRDAYARLHAEVEFRLGAPPRTILVTSTRATEGRSTVAMSWAVHLAMSGRRVGLLDCDFQNPSVARAAGLVDGPGEAGTAASSQEAICELDVADGASLSVISGRQLVDPAVSSFSSGGFADLLDSLRSRFEFTIIDSAGVSARSVTLRMASVVDAVLFVLRMGYVSEDDAKRAVDGLKRAGARLAGVVLTDFDENAHGPGVQPGEEPNRLPRGR